MLKGLKRLLLAAGAVGVASVGGYLYAATWHPAADAYPVQGVDVSAQTGAIDWNMARARGVDFGYAVATRGDRLRDPAFVGHWRDLRAAGVRRGALHVYSLCADATDQADHFNATVPRIGDALPAAVALDFAPDCHARPGRAAFLSDFRAFLSRVERHTGQPMLVRPSAAFEDEYGVSAALARTFWGTRSFLEPDYLAPGWRMWQASTIRRVEGFERPVNWNVVAS